MTYTPEQLRDSAAYTEALIVQRGLLHVTVDATGHMNQLRAHAAALEELARVKRAIAESCDEQRGEYFGCRRAERAEAALAESERKCERLKFHAEAMAAYIEKNYQGPCPAVLSAYRDEFKEAK